MTHSADDNMGRVSLTSPRVWDENSPLYEVFNNISLNEGDIVYVWMPDDFSTALVLGKCRDNSFHTNASNKTFTVLYESVTSDGWLVVSGSGTKFTIENSTGVLLMIDGTKILTDKTDYLLMAKELTQKLNALVNTFNSHTHPIPVLTVTGAVPAGTAPVVTTPSPTQSTSQTAQQFNTNDYTYNK